MAGAAHGCRGDPRGGFTERPAPCGPMLRRGTTRFPAAAGPCPSATPRDPAERARRDPHPADARPAAGGARAHRQVLHRARGRPRQHRHGLPVARSVLRPRRGDQVLPRRQLRRRRRRASRAGCSSPRRTWSACCSTRTSCRSTTPARRTAAATSSPSTCTARARCRPTAGPTPAARSTRSCRDHLQVRQGAALRAFARRHPPRHQAVEHPAHAGRRRAHHRLRHRAGRRLRRLAHRGHRRQPELHVAGAGAEPSTSTRAPTSIRSAR